MIRDNPRHILQRSFAEMWPRRHEPNRILPNGRDYTNTRGSLRDNIRGQRSVLDAVRRGVIEVPEGFVR